MVVFIFEEQIAAAIAAHKPQKELTADCADSTPSTTCNAQLQPSRTRSPSQLNQTAQRVPIGAHVLGLRYRGSSGLPAVRSEHNATRTQSGCFRRAPR